MTPEERQQRIAKFGFDNPTHALRALKKYLGMTYASIDNATDHELELASMSSKNSKIKYR